MKIDFLMVFLCVVILSTCYADDPIIDRNIPKGYFIPDFTVSPDHRYGVTVPMIGHWLHHPKDFDDAKNSLVDLKTGRVLAEIQATTGWDHANHNRALPSRWSKDGTLMLWHVDGKWFPDAYVLLKMEKDKVVWQTDILKAAQDAILEKTKKAAPDRYVAAKKDNEGSGSAYPEGFTIDVRAVEPLSLPLHIWAVLTSNPKQAPDITNLDSSLEAIIDSNGKFVTQSFKLESVQVYGKFQSY